MWSMEPLFSSSTKVNEIPASSRIRLKKAESLSPYCTRYSSLDQINKDNFKDLKIAWRWKPAIGPAPSSLGGTAQGNGDPRLAIYRSESTPIMARGVLQDFGVTLPETTKIRVWDSTAEIRYLVLPMRPQGTEGWSAEQLAELVTRDSMIGTGLPRQPGETA